eukprot:TRINITY_DN10940_c0_g1_i1.p1 TRINITY_DN10940_c0_g1~~TRINITY_DN10940_c0_g1_i1.p1  ORF type:complete len:362 (+),score=16.49 TRINITY_DN10940_c0_g1_i1:63-1148(+)
MSDLSKNRKGVRILCLDGGGMRGLIEVEMISILSQTLFGDSSGKKFVDSFDLICGTSTGGILTTGLCLGRSVQDCHQLYMDLGAKVFQKTWPFGSSTKAIQWLWNGERYSSSLFMELTEQYFGSQLLSDVKSLQKFFVVSTNATSDSWKPYLFRSYPRPIIKDLYDDDNCDQIYRRGKVFHGTSQATIPQALRATSAAPTYFKPLIYKNNDGKIQTFVDGGMTANNPTELAIFEARTIWPERNIDFIVSLGCGKPKHGQGSTNLLSLVDELIDVCSSAQLIHRNVKSWVKMTMSETSYLRFNPNNGEGSVPLDETDPNLLHKMMLTTTQYMATKTDKINKLEKIMTPGQVIPSSCFFTVED